MFSQQPRMVGRGSQRGRESGVPVPRGTGGRGGPGKIIIIPHSTGRETKLKTTENAWKPSAKEANSASSDEDAHVSTIVWVTIMKYYITHFKHLHNFCWI